MNKICPDVIVENELKFILDYRFKVKGICEVLTRDHMKVAFFGRFVIFGLIVCSYCSLKLANTVKLLIPDILYIYMYYSLLTQLSKRCIDMI